MGFNHDSKTANKTQQQLTGSMTESKTYACATKHAYSLYTLLISPTSYPYITLLPLLKKKQKKNNVKVQNQSFLSELSEESTIVEVS